MQKLILAILAGAFYVTGYAQEGVFTLKENYTVSSTGTIYLNTDDANITIEGSDREDASVDIYRDLDISGVSWGSGEFEVEVEERNGDLYIREKKRSNYTIAIGSFREEYEITIKLPSTVSLDLKGDDDDYNISDINGSIEIDADDSDVKLTNCKGNMFRIELDDGDLEMDGGSGTLDLNMDDGDAYIRNGSFNKVSADFDDGDFELETSLDDDGDYYMSSSDGRITLIVTGGGGRFDISMDDGYLRADDAFESVEDREHRKVLRLPKGNARIRISADDARITLENM